MDASSTNAFKNGLDEFWKEDNGYKFTASSSLIMQYIRTRMAGAACKRLKIKAVNYVTYIHRHVI